MNGSVVEVAWAGAGQPQLDEAREGSCARCGQKGPVSTSTAVSKNFSGYDDWVRPGRVGTCAACTWAYRTEWLRKDPCSITANGFTRHSRPQLREVLGRALRVDEAVVLPIRPGRKHLLPVALWGRVTTDSMSLPWTDHDAARLGLVERLRALGFTPWDLPEQAPPFRVLRRNDRAVWGEVLQAWEDLAPWRASPAHLDVAVCATQADKSAAA